MCINYNFQVFLNSIFKNLLSWIYMYMYNCSKWWRIPLLQVELASYLCLYPLQKLVYRLMLGGQGTDQPYQLWLHGWQNNNNIQTSAPTYKNFKTEKRAENNLFYTLKWTWICSNFLKVIRTIHHKFIKIILCTIIFNITVHTYTGYVHVMAIDYFVHVC